MKTLGVLTATLLAVLASASAFAAGAPKPHLPKNALPVPLVRQAAPYSCGSAAVLSVLYYWQAYDGSETGLFPELNTTEEEGTDPLNMTKDMKENYGLESSFLENLTLDDLRGLLAKGYTVIVDYQAWRDDDEPQGPWTDAWEDGHYSVMVGMDANFIYVMDPSTAGAYGYIPLTEFVDRWHDYEIRNGVSVKYSHEGIAVKGKDHAKSVPGPIGRVE